jgi:hypothetical protein
MSLYEFFCDDGDLVIVSRLSIAGERRAEISGRADPTRVSASCKTLYFGSRLTEFGRSPPSP